MSGRDKIVLQKIERYILDALYYIDGMDFDAFSNDSKTISATAFVLGQIGELAKEVSAETVDANHEIQWKGMRGLRNRIVHDYENVDLAILWDTLSNDLPVLQVQIRTLIMRE